MSYVTSENLRLCQTVRCHICAAFRMRVEEICVTLWTRRRAEKPCFPTARSRRSPQHAEQSHGAIQHKDVCMYAIAQYIREYIFAYINMYIYVHVYIYILIFSHTHTHVCIECGAVVRCVFQPAPLPASKPCGLNPPSHAKKEP